MKQEHEGKVEDMVAILLVDNSAIYVSMDIK